MQTASRQMSALARRDYHNTGLGALNWLSELVSKIDKDDEAYQALIVELQAIHRMLLQAPKHSYWFVKNISLIG